MFDKEKNVADLRWLMLMIAAGDTHFDAQALTELTALIGLQNLSARFNSAMDIPAQGLCRIPEKRF